MENENSVFHYVRKPRKKSEPTFFSHWADEAKPYIIWDGNKTGKDEKHVYSIGDIIRIARTQPESLSYKDVADDVERALRDGNLRALKAYQPMLDYLVLHTKDCPLFDLRTRVEQKIDELERRRAAVIGRIDTFVNNNYGEVNNG